MPPIGHRGNPTFILSDFYHLEVLSSVTQDGRTAAMATLVWCIHSITLRALYKVLCIRSIFSTCLWRWLI